MGFSVAFPVHCYGYTTGRTPWLERGHDPHPRIIPEYGVRGVAIIIIIIIIVILRNRSTG